MYRQILKLGILDAIRSVRPHSGEWKVVVVDEASLKIIESACKMFDILEEKVTCKSVYFTITIVQIKFPVNKQEYLFI